jgi:hypothetical protein
MSELPSMTTSSYASSTANPDWANQAFNQKGAVNAGGDKALAAAMALARRTQAYEENVKPSGLGALIKEKHMAARIVRVYIADPDPNIPLDKQLLYTGGEKLTDSTDQELFYEIPIQMILTDHNTYRATVIDKKASDKFGKEIRLEPIRIRDLKMAVVVIATF